MKTISIFWGNQFSSPVNKANYHASFDHYRQTFGSIFVPQQNHGVVGHVIDQTNQANYAQAPLAGDYLITNLPNIALGVLTADCLPIVFYDHSRQVLAVVHAGWRGSLAGIAGIVLKKMGSTFGCQTQDLEIFFGPAGGVCCYEVQADFIANLALDQIALACLKQQGQKYFFDVLRYNMLCLQNCDIPINKLNLSGFICTICNFEYCSYRRAKLQTGLQLSLAVMR